MKLLVLLVTLLVLSWTSAEDLGDQEILENNEDNNHESELGEPAAQHTDDETSQLGQALIPRCRKMPGVKMC
uniref:Natterin-P n=1 Tax=Thalassophryne nattereri TaxID=289382 RepID=NATTP_THANI|nr:RecName: Full=Natterin-P; Flags: Precursor [Thalassophryne nattereri]AAU11826.1 natterin P precursor [Thalassophryne nattereri]